MANQRQKKPRRQHFPWIRMVITIMVLLFIVVVIILNVQGSTILAVLGVIFTLFQWLFPFSTNKQDTSFATSSTSPTPQVIVHIPSSLSLRSSTTNMATTHDSIVEPSSNTNYQTHQQDQKQDQISAPDMEKTRVEALQLRSDLVFLFNEPLTDSKEFYGRIRDRITLINRTSKGVSTSIVGPRRIGKTWLISYLKLVTPTELGTHFRIGYLDATMASCKSVAGFTSTVLEELGIHTFVPDHANVELVMLEKVVRDMRSKNQIPILCIDEFEGFGNRKAFDLDFFNGLRAMTQAGLGLVVSSKRPLIDIVGDYGKTSGFFNVFEQIALKPFSAEEAEEFIRAKALQAGFTDQIRARILKYGQKGEQQWPPLRLQLTGKLLMEDKILALSEGSQYYRPEDPNYWREFEERLEEKYRGVVR